MAATDSPAWGPIVVERTAHIEGRGYVVSVRTKGSYERSVQVYVSEKGRSMRVYVRGEMDGISLDGREIDE